MAWAWGFAAAAAGLYSSIGIAHALTTTYRWPKHLVTEGTISLEEANKYWARKALWNAVAWPFRQLGDHVDTYDRHDSDTENERADEVINGYTNVRCTVPVLNREW